MTVEITEIGFKKSTMRKKMHLLKVFLVYSHLQLLLRVPNFICQNEPSLQKMLASY